MARTNLTVTNPLGAYPTLPISASGADLLFSAIDDPTDRSTSLISGKTMILAFNTDVSARTITFTSAQDTFHRTGDISAYSIAAGKVSMFGPFSSGGWAQPGSLLYIDVSNPKVRLAVLQLP